MSGCTQASPVAAPSASSTLGSTVQYTCHVCSLSFSSDSEANAHHKTSFVHPSCRKCGIFFQDKTEHCHHLQIVHQSDVCVCSVPVKLDNLQAHYRASRSHHKCSKCRFAFRDDTELLEHERTAHASRQRATELEHPGVTGAAGTATKAAPLAGAHQVSVSGIVAQPVSQQFASAEGPINGVKVEGDAGSHILLNTISPFRSEVQFEILEGPPIPDSVLLTVAALHMTKKSVAKERHEEITTSDDYEHIDTDECASDTSARATQGRSDTEFDHHEETDCLTFADSVSLAGSVSCTRRADYIATLEKEVINLDDVVHQLRDLYDDSKAQNAALQREVGGLKQVVAQSQLHVNAPCSDACTLGPSTRTPKLATSVDFDTRHASSPPDAPHSLVTEQSRSSIARHPSTSEGVSAVTTPMIATTTGRSIAASEPAMSPTPASGASWRCRICGTDPCEDPTATQCGHIFCYSCIAKEIAENMQCPVCQRVFLLRLVAF